ncbi:hypothetical protein CRC_01654 [Cylindrospermopsis raciborskii CS-505]|nr:hypothetical protein CRC_01654 [Cylindrospermopsis raciborskii CS-505]
MTTLSPGKINSTSQREAGFNSQSEHPKFGELVVSINSTSQREAGFRKIDINTFGKIVSINSTSQREAGKTPRSLLTLTT